VEGSSSPKMPPKPHPHPAGCALVWPNSGRGSTGAPRLQRRAVRDHRERAAERWLGLPPARSQDRRRPGELPAFPLPPGLPDEPSVPPPAGWADGYLSAIEWRCVGSFTDIPCRSVTLSMDETSRQAFVRSGVTGLLEAP
jgi:hypothetical protein